MSASGDTPEGLGRLLLRARVLVEVGQELRDGTSRGARGKLGHSAKRHDTAPVHYG